MLINSLYDHRVNTASRTEAMAERDLRATDPAAQPTKADMEEDGSIAASPEALACAVTMGRYETGGKTVEG